jgi:hypothetical protein
MIHSSAKMGVCSLNGLSRPEKEIAWEQGRGEREKH